MTRRDYCTNCSDFVGDYGPTCVKCERIFCVDCPTTNDPLSRISILLATMVTYSKPDLSIEEIKQFIKDAQTDEVKQYMNDTYPIEEDDGYNINVDFNEIKDKFIQMIEDNCDKEMFIEILSDFRMAMPDPFPFTCNMCYNGIEVRY